MIFLDWLKETKAAQEGWFLRHYDSPKQFHQMTDQQRVAYIKEQKLAIDAELIEFMDEMSWKPWASAVFLNREAALGEMVDVLHFVANALCALEVDDQELTEAYVKKLQRNVERQKEGYTGTRKCTVCHRAIDDIEARGEVFATLECDDRAMAYVCSSCLAKDFHD